MTQYWFKPKSYGYGATPTTWQGWAVSLAFAGAVLGSIAVMTLLVDKSNAIAWLVWGAFIAVGTFWLVQVSRRRTDGEWHWRWGRRPDAPTK